MIEKDEHKTRVIFRMQKWITAYGVKKEDVVALFPYIANDDNPGNCTAYVHVGQHTGAYISGFIRESRLATPEEYADLFRELEDIGYNLEVGKREPRNAFDVRCEQIREWRKPVVEVIECGCCGEYHRLAYTGDCRDDAERFTDLEDAAERLGKVVEVIAEDANG